MFTLWEETKAFRSAIKSPPEKKRVRIDKKKNSAFTRITLKEYTWGGLLKKVYREDACLLCCGGVFLSASSARDHKKYKLKDG